MNAVQILIRRLSYLPNGFGVLGAPFGGGQKKLGVETAPQLLRSSGLLSELKVHGADVQDYGDFSGMDVSSNGKAVSEAVSEVLKSGRVPITIGGDHSIALGTIQAHHKYDPETIVIWIDAHADIHVPESSPSGNQHGMVLSMLAKELSNHWADGPHIQWTGPPTFSLSNLMYLGLRSFEKFEKETIEKHNITAYYMYEIDRQGAKTVLHRGLKLLDPDNTKPIHVSFDIDALDPIDAPSTGTPVRGGLTLREAISLVEYIVSKGRLQGIDLVEVNPSVGSEEDKNRTLDSAIQILKAAVGFERGGFKPLSQKKAAEPLISTW